MMNGNRPNILVLGGGFGGLEAAFYLRMKLEDRADITLVSDRDYFLFKPNTPLTGGRSRHPICNGGPQNDEVEGHRQ
jgi:NADH dehydrogenase FAD-containing subunit